MNGLDEKRIQEIVEKVMARLGGGLPSSPLEAVERAAVQAAPRAPAVDRRAREVPDYLAFASP